MMDNGAPTIAGGFAQPVSFIAPLSSLIGIIGIALPGNRQDFV
jgi:hypothetical protein